MCIICICMYIYIYVCMYTYVFMYICMCMQVYGFVFYEFLVARRMMGLAVAGVPCISETLPETLNKTQT